MSVVGRVEVEEELEELFQARNNDEISKRYFIARVLTLVNSLSPELKDYYERSATLQTFGPHLYGYLKDNT